MNRKHTLTVVFLLALLVLIAPAALAQEDELYEVITTENLSDLVQVGVLGRGIPLKIRYEDMGTLALHTVAGVWRYDVDSLTSVPQWESADWTELSDRPSETSAAGLTVEVTRLDNLTTLSVYNPEEQRELMHLQFLPSETVWAAELSADGTRLAVAGSLPGDNAQDSIVELKTISIWDVDTASRMETVFHPGVVTQMLFSPDLRHFVAHGNAMFGTYALTLHDLLTGQTTLTIQDVNWRPLIDAAFSPDSIQLAVAYGDARMEVYDTASGALVAEVRGYPGYAVNVNFSDDRILVATSESEAIAWDNQHFSAMAVFEGCELLSYQALADLAFCGEKSGFDTTYVLRSLDGNRRTAVELPQDDRIILAASFHPFEPQLAVLTYLGRVYLIDLYTGMITQTLEASGEQGFGLQYSEDGHFLIAGSKGTVWDLRDSEKINQAQIQPAWHSAFAFSTTENWIALPSYSGEILVWRWHAYLEGSPAVPEAAIANLLKREPPGLEQNPHGQFLYLAGSPDGRLLVISDPYQTVVFDTKTFEQVHTIPDGGGLIRFSPDGRILLIGDGYCYCGSADETLQVGYVRVWGSPR